MRPTKPETLKRLGLKLEALEDQIATERFHIKRAYRSRPPVYPVLGQLVLKRLVKEKNTLRKRLGLTN